MNTIRSPASPAPLSASNTYTTWPGGVDPTARLFNTDNQSVLKGGRRSSRKASRKANRKANRKSRRANRKSRKANRRSNRK